MKAPFWAKVFFSEFIRHYRKLDDAAIVADVRQSMDDLEELRAAGESFGAKMVRWSEERIANNRRTKGVYGSKGGRPRKQQQITAVRVSGSGDAPAPVTSEAISSPDGTDELYAFAAANDLDEIDAREWYEMSEKRGWKDRYGNPIRDWELACEAYCARKALNRLKKEAK